jgi:GR25 family glycosyltransferase involved in LPS biosynthesis
MTSIRPKQTICLNMIVKNESHIIEETLDLLLHYIDFDYWVICDTGSTDNTQNIIREYFEMADISGELIVSEWKDFGHNRTIALEKAFRKTDYLFIWDADDEIVGDFKLPDVLREDSYTFQFGGNTYYRRVQLVKNSLIWKYEGVLHEYIVGIDSQRAPFYVEGDYHFVSGRRGSRNKNPNKYRDDAIILEDAYIEAVVKKDKIQSRYAFYTANSYRDANINDKAIEYYKKVLDQNAWDQEKYISCLELYELYKRIGDEIHGLYYLVESTKYDKTRAECIYRLVKYYTDRNMYDVAYTYYSLIKTDFESQYGLFHKDRLFLRKQDYIFNLPNLMIPVCCKTKNTDSLMAMYEILLTNKTITNSLHTQQFFNNLIHIFDLIEYSEETIGTLDSILEYVETTYEHNIILNTNHFQILNKMIDKFKPFLIQDQSDVLKEFKNKAENPKIIFTMTTCKRLNLFEQTMNSIINTWTDIDKIDYFFCVDDNSSDKDREIMKQKYPFFNFHMKTASELGHRESMNIIWDKLNMLKPTYWIHMEDDWLFLRPDNYVEKSMNFLDIYKKDNINQILFNRNYGEILEHYNYSGGRLLKKGFKLHEKRDDLKGVNCGYWPHYSFRPSMVLVENILKLGNFDSPNKFFEMDYAKKYNNMGFKSAFFDAIRCLHIGKLVGDKNGVNAYTLNEVAQFVSNKYIINLERRQDRRDKTKAQFDKHKISDYEIYKAIEGNKLILTQEIKHLFRGNDFGNKKAVIGCALSHYSLWKKLISDKHNKYYIIFEDDIEFSENFETRMKEATTLIQTNDTIADILFLGYHALDDTHRFSTVETKSITDLDKNIYIGGFFSYIITKRGAERMMNYISIHGIKHGIDYLIKIVRPLKCITLQPHIIYSEWVKNPESAVDSDIQKETEVFDFSTPVFEDSGWLFIPNKDSMYGDVRHEPDRSKEDLLFLAGITDHCIAVNTLGFFKSTVTFPLISPFAFGTKGQGIYIKRSYLELKNKELYGDRNNTENTTNIDYINLINQ